MKFMKILRVQIHFFKEKIYINMKHLKNFKNYLNESLTAEGNNKMKAKLVENVNSKISKLISKYAGDIKKISAFVDVNKLIEECKKWLTKYLPEQLAGIQQGRSPNTFIGAFIEFLKGLIKKELDNMAFLKKKAMKALCPSKEKFQSEVSKFQGDWLFFDPLERILDAGFAIGAEAEMKKYEDQCLKWSQGATDYINSNKKKIRQDIVNIFYNFLYS